MLSFELLDIDDDVNAVVVTTRCGKIAGGSRLLPAGVDPGVNRFMKSSMTSSIVNTSAWFDDKPAEGEDDPLRIPPPIPPIPPPTPATTLSRRKPLPSPMGIPWPVVSSSIARRCFILLAM